MAKDRDIHSNNDENFAEPYVENNEIMEKPSKFVLQLRSWLETDMDEYKRHSMPLFIKDVLVSLETIPYIKFCKCEEGRAKLVDCEKERLMTNTVCEIQLKYTTQQSFFSLITCLSALIGLFPTLNRVFQ